MKTLILLFAISLLPAAVPAGEVVKRDVRYKKSGPITSQYVFQANGSRRSSTSYSSRNRTTTAQPYNYGYSGSGSIRYPYSSFRSCYPAHRSTRVTVIRRPVVVHRPAVRVNQSYYSYRPVSPRCR